MEQEPMQAVYERNARATKEEQTKLMAWMRRHTPLEEEVIEKALSGIVNVSFDAGHDIGWNEAMRKANFSERRNRILSWITFVVTAALVGSIWFMFTR